MSHDDVVAHNRTAWDRQVAAGDEWTVGASPETIAAVRAGDFSGVVLIGHKPVPRDWLPANLHGVDALCLASGGGQQGPQLAAAGANVTVFDNSPGQLERDRQVAAREGLTTRTVLGDMRDLSDFADASFDLILNPVSNVYCPELEPVWRECFRVLRPGGTLLAGFMNPDIYIFDSDALDDRDELIVRHSLPYSDTESLTPEELEQRSEWPLEFSHTMTEQIAGQLSVGFIITGFDEAPHHSNATAKFMPGYFATRAVKPG
ncbi:MAG: class I SAM-dependent methyltransferase [Dehalococcoidia bacterium]